MVPHAAGDEQYLSIERLRGGFRILHSTHGGVDIEDSPESITQYDTVSHVPLPQAFLTNLIDAMDREHCSFVEINPLLVRGDSCLMLDAAVLVDSAADWQSQWSADDIVEASQKTKSEQTIASLNEGSPASFSFRVLNSNAPIWLLLSGGGASITIADEAANRGKADLIGNYGEYSGGPTREETQLYAEAVIQQLYLSSAPKKAIVIAGGVANFTDVRKTFLGIIDALTIHAPRLREMGVKVFVRRGGPNEKEGLKLMKEFLESQDMYGSIHGSADVLTVVVDEALEYVDV
jgi:ATP-citrate lyase beta-subunit